MNINIIQTLEKYLDIGVILLCMAIILVFLWNKFLKNNQKFKKKIVSKKSSTNFSDEINAQFMSQQFVKSFEIISEAVNSQRILLFDQIMHLKSAGAEVQLDSVIKSAEDNLAEDPYSTAAGLADSGYNRDDISKMVKRPRCEIDLVLNLRKLSQSD